MTIYMKLLKQNYYSKGPVSPGKSIDVEHLVLQGCVTILSLSYIFQINQENFEMPREAISLKTFLRRNGV